jgi:hypothetical protein
MKNYLFALLAFSSSLQALATPAQIVITRHGEKPDSGNELNIEGCERAYSLPAFFTKNSVVQRFGQPAGIFAMEPGSDDGSIRPIQTIAPTADAFGLTINDSYVREDYNGIVQAVLSNPSFNGKTILISWEHKAIPGLAEAFGLKLQAETKNWPDAVFDQAWVLDFEASDDQSNPDLSKHLKVSLEIIPEFVMPTDNPNGGLDSWSRGPVTPGRGPTLSPQIQQECQSNASLNALVRKWVKPGLPDATWVSTPSL